MAFLTSPVYKIKGAGEYDLALPPQKTAVLEFEGIPSAGYQWQIHKVPDGIDVGDIKEVSRSTDGTDMVGGYSVYHLPITASDVGLYELELRYLRPWIKDDYVSVLINVKAFEDIEEPKFTIKQVKVVY